MKYDFYRLSIVSLGFLLLDAGCSWAHGLSVFPRFRGDKVEIIAKFSDGTVARKAAVEVYDAKNKVIHSGTTDSKGRWSFPKPGPGEYRITVNAGAGHLAATPLSITTDALSTDLQNNSAKPRIVDDSPAFYWAKVGTGIAVIGVICLALFVAKRAKTHENP